MNKINIFITGFICLGLLCLKGITPADSLKNGVWRSTLQRTDGQQINFNFEVKDSIGKKVIYIINGSERLLVDSVKIAGDSIFIQMPFFESGFKAKLLNDVNLEGVWVKKSGQRLLSLPFKAVYNETYRFLDGAIPVYNITGRWAVHFKSKNRPEEESVGEFVQRGHRLTGTFLNPSGDYRFLEGIVNGDSLKLSGFDGGHVFLFTAKIESDGIISGGKFYSGPFGVQEWTAVKDAKAALPDGYSKTKLKPGFSKLDFSFKSVSGKTVSINDSAYKNKVVIVQILGSWCPNCMDETQFLSNYYNKNRSKGVEVIGLAYEATTDFETSKKALQPFQKRFNVQYPILVPGVTVQDSLRTEKTLPQVDQISAFPTTIFIDKKGNVRKIHTGYDGPATGEHYLLFKKEFNELVVSLQDEK